MNGKTLGDVFDAYAAAVEPSGEIKLGSLDLTAGGNKLEIEIVGANEKSKGRFVGFDYVRLVSVAGKR